MDPELKRRPLLFEVRPSQHRPPLGVITQEESEKLQLKHRRPHDRVDDDAFDNVKGEEDNNEPILPAGALPAVFSPRIIKKSYTPAPSHTPKYFRWKPQSTMPRKPQFPFQGKPLGSPPVVLSPSAQRRQSIWKVPVDTRAPLHGDNNATPASRGRAKSPSSDQLGTNASTVAPWIEDHEPTELPELPGTPESNYFLFDGPAPRPELTTPVPVSAVPTTPGIPSTLHDTSQLTTPIRPLSDTTSIRPSSKPVVATAVRMQTPTNLQVSGSSIEPQTPLPEAVPGTAAPIRLEPLSPPTEPVHPPHSAPLYNASPPEEAQPFEAEPEPRSPGRVDDLATPIVIRKAGDTQPQVFTQHVLRGVILRKYLQVNNIARRLRETEKHVLRVNALTSSSGSFGKSPTVPASPVVLRPRKSSLECIIDNVTEEATGAGPIIGRLASVDKAISQTAHRMRLMSSASIPVLTAQNLAKGSSLRTIGEGKKFIEPAQVTTPREKQKRQPSGIPELNEDE